MATATKTSETKKVLKEVEEKVDTITLTLSITEAEAVQALVGSAGRWMSENKFAKAADAVYNAFTNKNIPLYPAYGQLSGSVTFRSD